MITIDDTFMPNVIGQNVLKQRFKIYSESFRRSSILPFLCFTAARGYGKTYMMEQFNEHLIDSEGRERPFVEVNAATIKNIDQFIDIWYPKMRDLNATLFIDECQELPAKVQSMLLTVCAKQSNPRRHFRFERRDVGEVTIPFDFREYSLVFATTDFQKLDGALQDRLTQLTIAQYTEEELYLIFEQKLEEMSEGEVTVSNDIADDIMYVFRGHPRSSFELAEQLNHFAQAIDARYIGKGEWDAFRASMGIHDFGLNDTELHVIQIIGKYGAQSLNDLAAKTECTRSFIQNHVEMILKKKNLMTVDGKRMLTMQGQELFRKLFC